MQSRIRAKRLLEILPETIEEGEQLLHVATWSRGLLVATNRRLIVLNSADGVQAIEYSRIISFSAAKDRRKPFMQIQTESGELLVSGLGAGYEDICRMVHARIWDVTLERVSEPARVEPIRRAAGAA